MRTSSIVLLAAVAGASAIVSAEEAPIDGSAAAIRAVISGKTCVGEDVLKFAESVSGAAGVFERAGRPPAIYAIGYGTIVIDRDGKLHSHVTSVSVPDRMLYMSTGKYRCGIRR